MWRGILSVAMSPNAELLIFCLLLVNVGEHDRKKVFGRIIFGIVAGTALLLVISLTALAVLGRHSLDALKYPFYNAMMLTGIKGMLERLDPLAIVIIIMCGYYKGTLYIYTSAEMIRSLSRKIKFNWVLAVVGIVFFLTPPGLNLHYDNFLKSILPFYIMPWFQVGLPLIVWAISEWRAFSARKEGSLTTR
ncbi:MAG: GerAB/ArcD/ProY family transporter [Turicibacter sp.]|nr:GerAB/ArcD/ProY family transporter [Turicibacter sp.]